MLFYITKRGGIMIVDYDRISKKNIEQINKDNKISWNNKKNFNKYLNAIDVSPARVGIICRHIKLIFYQDDDVIKNMQNREKVNLMFKALKENYKLGYYETIKSVGKAFVRWFNDDETPKGWKDIKSKKKESQRRDLSPKDMISWEEGLKLISYSSSIQIKAIFMTQLDGGFRPSEFIDLNYGDLTKEGKYYTAKVNGKTGKRNVILFKCIPYLEKWLKEHPIKEDKSPLWLTETIENSKNKELRYQYPAIRKKIKKLAIKSKLNKPLDFYNLRHSSAVIKKLDNIPVDICALNMGHSVKHFVEVYGRLSLKDLTNRYDKAYGIKKAEDEQNNPIVCQFCNTTNEPKIDYCVQCGNPLNLRVAVSERNKMNLLSGLMQDPEKIDKLLKAVELLERKK